MTREEAQEFLTSISWKLGNMSIEYLSEKDGDKMREAIEVLEQEPCEDTISRTHLQITLMDLGIDHVQANDGRELIQILDDEPSVQPEQKFSRIDVFEILHKIKEECWNCGMNMTGEYQGAWTRFRDIEKIIDKYMAESEDK